MHSDTCQKYAVKMDTEFAHFVKAEKYIKSLKNDFVANNAKSDLVRLLTAGTVN